MLSLLFSLAALANSPAVDSQSVHASYEVLLPNAADPVVYEISLMQTPPAPDDSIMGYNYLIDWTLNRPNGAVHGFSAYYDGNHFRYRDGKMQEYHVREDATPFNQAFNIPAKAQFVELLPVNVLAKVAQVLNDSTCTYTWDANRNVLSGKQRSQGYDVLDFRYAFDTDGFPREVEYTYNPASISEQTITVTFARSGAPVNIDENLLETTYPAEFNNFRTSNFKARNMVGQRLPSFSLKKSTDGQRFTYTRGQAMDTPLVLCFIDPDSETTSAIEKDMTQIAGECPVPVNVFTVTDNKTSPVGNRLLNASQLRTECGVTTLPTVLIMDRDGTVTDVTVGSNNNLAQDVISKVTALR